jgi:diguanylate cyclase (GGDEF)-like protein
MTMVLALLLLGRALVAGPDPHRLALVSIRAALALALLLAGGLGLVEAFRSKLPRFSVWSWGDSRWIIILIWSAFTSAADILAGDGPAVFAAGVIFAAAIGWPRMGRLVLLVSLACLVVILSSLACFFLRFGPLRREDILLELAAATLALAVAATLRSLVVPGLERLQSLERANEKLLDLSYRDALTGVYNRRFAQEIGRLLLTRAMRFHDEFHVMLIDIDHFKAINDEHSHAQGDEVLKEIARTIQSCIRSDDSVARYGGDEFLAFLVKAEGEMAQFIANRVREAVAVRSFADPSLHVTVSIGMASFQADADLDALIDRADKFLYASKRAGRNRAAGF